MSAVATDWRARTRTALERGETVLGTFVKSPDPAVAEILAGAGFELLVADLEHSSLTVADVATIVRAAEPFEVAVMARIPAAAITEASRLLETGAIGVQVTDVVDPATLAELRDATRFPPAGRRSLALTHRDAGFGRIGAAAYIDQAHARLVTVAQVESRAGVAALPELLASPDQPDVWFIGPFDLSTDLGYPGELEHPDVQAAFDELLRPLGAAGARIGVFARDAADAAAWRARGASFLLLSSDVTLLAGAARSMLAAARSALTPPGAPA
jgi:2-keto-3-deoxy-L-rhamnonate aldolase RhmA